MFPTKLKSFTLVELLIVIVIVAVLAGVTIIIINPARQRARAEDAVLQRSISEIAAVIENYHLIRREYPNGTNIDDFRDFANFVENFSLFLVTHGDEHTLAFKSESVVTGNQADSIYWKWSDGGCLLGQSNLDPNLYFIWRPGDPSVGQISSNNVSGQCSNTLLALNNVDEGTSSGGITYSGDISITASTPVAVGTEFFTSDAIDDAIAWWQMDEGLWTGVADEVVDSSGFGNHGRAFNGAVPSSPGRIRNAGYFDGRPGVAPSMDLPRGPHVLVNSDVSDPLDFDANFSISLWFKTPNTGRAEGLINRGAGFYPGGFVEQIKLMKRDDTGVPASPMAFEFAFDRADTGTRSELKFGSKGQWSDNQWHHMVVVYSAPFMRAYVDGVLVGQENVGNYRIQANGQDWFIGQRGDYRYYYTGFLDDIRIYNRGLSSAQISRLYNFPDYEDKSNLVGPISNGIIGYWRLEENVSGDGHQLLDSSGNSYHARTVGSGVNCRREGIVVDEHACSTGGVKDNWISIPSLARALNPSITVSAWVKWNGETHTTDTSTPPFISGIWGHEEDLINPQNNSHFEIRSSGVRIRLGSFVRAGMLSPQVDAWTHMAFTYNGSIVRYYINGREVDSFGGSSGFIFGGPGHSIGDSHWGNRPFSGDIDEVIIYDRALSSSEILSLRLMGDPDIFINGYTINQGLVGYWRLDETNWTGAANEVIDWSGNGLHGTAQNSSGVLPNTVTGRFGRAGSFASSPSAQRQRVVVPHSPQLNITDALSISAWIRLNGNQAQYTKIVHKSRGADNNPQQNYVYQLNFGLNNVLIFQVANNNVGPVVTSVSSGAGLPFNTWIHIAAIFNGQSLRLYQDGELVGAGNITEQPYVLATNDYYFGIGGRSESNMSFNGRIDDVRLYDRALTTQEVDYLAEFGPGPTIHWALDENSGNSAPNLAGGGGTGTLVNNPGWVNGRYGNALSFNGVNQYVTTGNIFYSDQLTVCAWVNPSVQDNNPRTILTKRNSSAVTSGTAEWWFYLLNGSVQWMSWNSSSNIVLSMETNLSVELNTWTHVCAVQNGEGNIGYIYLDGIMRANSVQTDRMRNSSSLIQVGVRTNNNNNRYFDGLIDDARIYTEGLDPARINKVFRGL